jgi:hypothetical protein
MANLVGEELQILPELTQNHLQFITQVYLELQPPQLFKERNHSSLAITPHK